MAIYEIRYVETNVGYFGVEADSYDEALERFKVWNSCNDHIYNTMRQGWNADANCDVSDIMDNNLDGYFDEEDLLTEEKYLAL